jgi:hypothetical protein
MPRVIFTRNFDFNPRAYGGRVTLAFKAGMRVSVTRECKQAALESGAIENDTDQSRKTD